MTGLHKTDAGSVDIPSSAQCGAYQVPQTGMTFVRSCPDRLNACNNR